MTRSLACAALAASLFALSGRHVARAEEPKATGTVDLASSVPDAGKLNAFEGIGVLLDQKEWERLAAAWGIKEVPKVDFSKELLLVGTWRGTNFKFLSQVKNGDRVVEQVGDKNTEPGFRFRVMSLRRAGITKFNGKELPKPAKSKLEPIESATTVNLSGSIQDASLLSAVPENGVITSQEQWEALAKKWGIKEPPRVDFRSQVLVVGATRGSTLSMNPVVKGGDLSLNVANATDNAPGFRWRVQTVSRDGLKTVGGKPLTSGTELKSGNTPNPGTRPNPTSPTPNPPTTPPAPAPGATAPNPTPPAPVPPANPTAPTPGAAPRP
jgi:hypothetical protein